MPETTPLQKVLIANRGEIAVRVIRACKDAGIGSVAVYAEPDRDALFVRLADQAHALGGSTPAESYLDIDKIIALAEKSGADSVHPGYGFLAENAGFAQAVIDAGLIWIGPPPAAIESLGDKVRARHIAEKVGAPLAPGTKDPLGDADEAVAFAEEFGLPIAIKAAFGGGGRGLKVAREMSEVADAYDSAVREAVSAFGRGECFVEKFLDRPRHVETQCLADQHGNVVVVSTRDCSLQRRHQKLVEEAPAPFLSDDQVARLYESSKAILREAGYVGAGTCEFLVARDGTISFLEVNTRLQVEHCVSEEVTGIDLVREMFRIAAGEELGYADPEVRGHSIEFRINAEDGGAQLHARTGHPLRVEPTQRSRRARWTAATRTARPSPARSTRSSPSWSSPVATAPRRWSARAGPSTSSSSTACPPSSRSTARSSPTRPTSAFRSTPRRAFEVYTTWIETDFDNQISPTPATRPRPRSPASARPSSSRSAASGSRSSCPAASAASSAGRRRRPRSPSGPRARRPGPRSAATPSPSPMQGTVVKVVVEEGQEVAEGDTIVVIEAMKMEQPLKAHKAGTVTGLTAEVGATITNGAVICEIKD